MSSKRARRASSPHSVTPFVAAVPTTPLPAMVPQEATGSERKTPRPKSIQATPDVRPRRSSLKATATSQPMPNILDRFRNGDLPNASPGANSPGVPHTPPLPSYLSTPIASAGSRERSNSYSVSPTGLSYEVGSTFTSPKRFAEAPFQRSPKPPPSPRQTPTPKPRSKSKSRRELSELQESEPDPPLPSKLEFRVPLPFQEQNSLSEDSPSPRPSRAGAASRVSLKPSRRAGTEMDSGIAPESRRYSHRVPVPRREDFDAPPTPSLPSEHVASPPRDLQKMAHFRVMNADPQSEGSDDAKPRPPHFSPIARQTPPVEFQRRYAPTAGSHAQSGRSPATEFAPSSPLAGHRSPNAVIEKEFEVRGATKMETHRSDDRRERRKSHSANDLRKPSRSASEARSPRSTDSPNQPRTPQLSNRVFMSETPVSESLTPRSSRPPQSQTFPSASPSTATVDTTPRGGKDPEPSTDKKSNRSRKNTEVKPVDASPRERSHALRGLFDKLGLGFAFDQTPQEAAPTNDLKPSSIPSPDHSLDSTGHFGEATSPVNQLDRQTALFTALSSTSSGDRDDPEPEVFFEPVRPFYDRDDREYPQSHVMEGDDRNVFGLTAATSLNRISASPNPDTHSDPASYQPNGQTVSQGNSDNVYFSPDSSRTEIKVTATPDFNTRDHSDRDRRVHRDAWVSNHRASSRGPREEHKDNQHEAFWSNGYEERLPPPPMPPSSPSIVIQPSTSISSNDAIPRPPSLDSVSQYSDNESVIEDRAAAGHQSRLPNGAPYAPEQNHSSIAGHGALQGLAMEGIGLRGLAHKRGGDGFLRDARSRELSQSSHSSFDDGSSTGTQPTIDKPLASASKTWKSTLPADALRSLLEKYGAIEMRRQEVIWELCNTEQEFVESLRTILRLFVQPLRTKDGKWIPGLPADITSLFDWLDDIIRLHSHISTALLDVRSSQYPIVLQVAEALRAFVPCLEFHQPYLVRLEAASQSIAEMAQDQDSDLGEFIRIQTASPECAGMPLSSFLLKPIQRLMKYPLFFKRLLELTPRNHPDYLATFSLMHSTDMVIKVMQEVKVREDEYDLVKNLAERIKGLPDGFQLASRERRLIAQGLLRRAFPNEKERVQLESSPATLPGPAAPEPPKPTPPTPSQPRVPLNTNMNKLFPITSPRFQQAFDLDVHPNNHYSRPDSMASEFSTEPSFGDAISDGTRSTTSSAILSPSTTVQSMRPDSIASSCASFDQDYMLRDPYAGYSESPSLPLRRRSSLRSLKGKREVPIYVFVFSDLVLLTVPVSERNILRSPRSGDSKDHWRVVDDVGISRVLGVKNLSGKLDHDHLLSIDLLPMAPGQDIDLSSSPYALPVYVSLPERMTSRMALAPANILEEARTKWFDAFDKCSKHTLRSLCFPPKLDTGIPGSLTLSPLPKSRGSVFAMLASGSPLLRSPSRLNMDSERRPEEEESPERQERQWWSAQFQKVMREMERREIAWMTSGVNSTMAVQPQHRRTADPKRASVMGGPRPLLLGSKLAASSATEERKGGLLRSLSRKGR